MKSIKIFALLFAIAVIGQSCRKDSNDFTVISPIIEPVVKVISSVMGEVLDDTGNAVEGATVTFEDQIIFTDDNGVFQFNNEQLYSDGTYIKVTKDGYFDGSRRFYASVGKTSRVVIQLMALEEVAEFGSSDGSTIKFENVELVFEPNSIMNVDGSPFSGNVNVAAKYLDPTLQQTLNQMPGDLTGIANNQERVVLTSLAMFAVELLDDNGNELQIQGGKTVDAKIPVPESLLSDAPSTIPMWYFDEEVGTWVEEGTAVLINDNYETSLPHFTFWNCDIPNDLVFLKGSIINREIPIQGASVVVTLSNGGTSASTVTDSEGFFCGYVPAGEDLILEVFNKCGNVIYSFNIPASEVDIFLDPFNLYIETNLASVSGSVTLCNGVASPQTYVSISQGLVNNIVIINDDLTFSANISYCDNNNDLLVRAVDPINVLSSETLNFSVDNNIVMGEIELCDQDILVDDRDGQKYLTVEIDGSVWTAENMRYDTDDGIPNGFDMVFSEVPEHYGRYYNFHSAQSACPDGWHIPSAEEYQELIDYFVPGTAREALTSIDDWVNGPNGNNSSGFNGFPTGIANQLHTNPMLQSLGKATTFWSSTQTNTTSAERLSINNQDITTIYVVYGLFDHGSNVRCIQD